MSKKNAKKRTLKLGRVVLLVVLVLGLVGLGGSFWYNNNLKAVSKTDEVVPFTIESGQSAQTVFQNLAEEGIIRNADVYNLYARLNHLANIKAGEYYINKAWDAETLLTYLNDPTSAETHEVSVTLVEGDWAKDMASKIGAVTTVSEEDLLALWNDEAYIRSLMERYPFLTEDIFNANSRIYLEGYLAPNTYSFYIDTTPEAITEKILDQSMAVYTTYQSQFEASGLTTHELYTLASIVQYEASKPEDMKNVASVFYNRMATGMKLQSSVTVCYAINKTQDQDWTACEVNADFDSPYNTYMYEGLPPGPILNPGVDAIEATLSPNSTSYYYFMADVKGDGTVYFSETYEEHQALVEKYLK